MKLSLIILMAWGIFVCLIYVLLYCDTAFYKYNLPKVCKKVMDAFMEEE